jgi:hypothetical protein
VVLIGCLDEQLDVRPASGPFVTEVVRSAVDVQTHDCSVAGDEHAGPIGNAEYG